MKKAIKLFAIAQKGGVGKTTSISTLADLIRKQKTTHIFPIIYIRSMLLSGNLLC